MEHYYTNNPTTESREKIINSIIANENLKFYTDNGVFSKESGPDLRIFSLECCFYMVF